MPKSIKISKLEVGDYLLCLGEYDHGVIFRVESVGHEWTPEYIKSFTDGQRYIDSLPAYIYANIIPKSAISTGVILRATHHRNVNKAEPVKKGWFRLLYSTTTTVFKLIGKDIDTDIEVDPRIKRNWEYLTTNISQYGYFNSRGNWVSVDDVQYKDGCINFSASRKKYKIEIRNLHNNRLRNSVILLEDGCEMEFVTHPNDSDNKSTIERMRFLQKLGVNQRYVNNNTLREVIFRMATEPDVFAAAAREVAGDYHGGYTQVEYAIRKMKAGDDELST